MFNYTFILKLRCKGIKIINQFKYFIQKIIAKTFLLPFMSFFRLLYFLKRFFRLKSLFLQSF
ncbi:hypothetical protein EGI22_07320 [Lacihabitans sp. LS3-19]|nr:hypothetical protein [Lacihabitans sp. LS3-19]